MKKYIIMLLTTTICCLCVILYQNGYFGTTTEEIHGILEEVSLEELAGTSDLVVHGSVIDISEPYEIETNDGQRSIFTDYIIEPDTILRGESRQDRVLIRMQGGKMGRHEVIVEDNPTLALGDEAVFFLWQPHMGGGFNTQDDTYYYLNNMSNGVFYRSDIPEYFKTEQGEVLELASLPQKFTSLDPVDPERFRRENLEGLKSNLEQGFLTQKEYDLFVARMDEYAHVVE